MSGCTRPPGPVPEDGHRRRGHRLLGGSSRGRRIPTTAFRVEVRCVHCGKHRHKVLAQLRYRP